MSAEPIPKRIIIYYDGTWQSAVSGVRGSPSNTSCLYRCIARASAGARDRIWQDLAQLIETIETGSALTLAVPLTGCSPSKEENVKHEKIMIVTKYPEGEIHSKITAGKDGTSSSLAVVFCHSAITDHTMWDAQVEFLSIKGITCVQYDMLGFGSSLPSQDYLKSDPRPAIDHMNHILDLITHLRNSRSITKVIIAGLSVGGSFALRFATLHPDVVDGVMTAAGVVSGYDLGFWLKEEQDQDEEIEAAVEKGEVEKVARLQVHYWADGPLQKEGRCASALRERLYKWCLDIAQRRFDKTGGSDLPSAARSPITQQALEGLNMPFAVAIGRFDESMTNTMMEYLASTVKDVDVRKFDAAHMINLECPDEFNNWMYGWIEHKFI